MNIQAQKEKIKQAIDAIDNIVYLKAIDNLVQDAMFSELQPSKKVITIDDYLKRALQSEEDITAGKVKSLDDVIEESKHWHK
jgi:hypothetical protein